MIAVPALVYSVGAYGFFALPYTIIVYPLVFATMPRLWRICRENNHLTAADFVQGLYASRSLALVVAMTGIIATMPYIALQLIGMQVVVAALGFGGGSVPGASYDLHRRDCGSSRYPASSGRVWRGLSSSAASA